MMAKIEYRIMGVPSRLGNIHYLQELLGILDKDIFLDVEYKHNPMWTWKQAAKLSIDKDTTHLCIIQDDAALCDDFKDFCDYLINTYPTIIFTLLNHKDWSTTYISYGSIFQPGYVTSCLVSIVPVQYIKSIINCWETHWNDVTADDLMICYWAYHNNVKVCTSYPTCCDMIQEDGGIPSLLNHSENDRHSKNMVHKAMSINWNDKTYIKFANRDFTYPYIKK